MSFNANTFDGSFDPIHGGGRRGRGRGRGGARGRGRGRGRGQGQGQGHGSWLYDPGMVSTVTWPHAHDPGHEGQHFRDSWSLASSKYISMEASTIGAIGDGHSSNDFPRFDGPSFADQNLATDSYFDSTLNANQSTPGDQFFANNGSHTLSDPFISNEMNDQRQPLFQPDSVQPPQGLKSYNNYLGSLTTDNGILYQQQEQQPPFQPISSFDHQVSDHGSSQNTSKYSRNGARHQRTSHASGDGFADSQKMKHAWNKEAPGTGYRDPDRGRAGSGDWAHLWEHNEGIPDPAVGSATGRFHYQGRNMAHVPCADYRPQSFVESGNSSKRGTVPTGPRRGKRWNFPAQATYFVPRRARHGKPSNPTRGLNGNAPAFVPGAFITPTRGTRPAGNSTVSRAYRTPPSITSGTEFGILPDQLFAADHKEPRLHRSASSPALGAGFRSRNRSDSECTFVDVGDSMVRLVISDERQDGRPDGLSQGPVECREQVTAGAMQVQDEGDFDDDHGEVARVRRRRAESLGEMASSGRGS